MKTVAKAASSGRQKKKQEPVDCSSAPLKKKRGRKRRSPSPPPPPRFPHCTLSFFKIMIGNFRDVMYIPPLVAHILKGLDKKYVYIEDADGVYWNVEISLVDGSLAFQKGWAAFISAHSITVGEFVVLTYSGGLLFTARIFGTSSLERIDFQVRKRSGKCAKETCATDLKPVIALPSKRKKAFHASEAQKSSSITELLQTLKREKEAARLDFPSFQIFKRNSISDSILKVPSASEKFLHCDSNSKELEKANGSDQTSVRNIAATVNEVNALEELNIIFPTEHAKPDAQMISNEKIVSLVPSGSSLLSKQTKNSDIMTTTATCTFSTHSDVKEELPEMINSHNMGTNGNLVEETISDSLDFIESEPDNMAALSNLDHENCSQMENYTIKPNGVAQRADRTYDTLDDKLAELAVRPNFDVNVHEKPILCQKDCGAFGLEKSIPCETISTVSSKPILISKNINKEDNFLRICEEYEDPQLKDICHSTFVDVVEMDATPCSSCGNKTIAETSDSVDIPSFSCVDFSVCLSDDVRSCLELPRVLVSHIRKLKNDRKIVLLQDLSMRCWPVLYHQSNEFVGFIGGWADFAEANNIVRGDTCDFALIDKTELKFRVQITKQASVFDEKA